MCIHQKNPIVVVQRKGKVTDTDPLQMSPRNLFRSNFALLQFKFLLGICVSIGALFKEILHEILCDKESDPPY